MAVGYNPRTITEGLVLALDSANTKSHSGQYTYNWYDLINNIHFTGYNSPQWNTTFNSTHYNGSNEYYENSLIAKKSGVQFRAFKCNVSYKGINITGEINIDEN